MSQKQRSIVDVKTNLGNNIQLYCGRMMDLKWSNNASNNSINLNI